MLRSVPAVQFVFAKFEALLRNKESDEPLTSEFLDEASGVKRTTGFGAQSGRSSKHRRQLSAGALFRVMAVRWWSFCHCGSSPLVADG
jgi:hypothetical protein